MEKKWNKPEIIRIKLNSEQAVLSCCYIGFRGEVHTSVTHQCADWVCGTGTSVGNINSS
ncbi:MAG: hypothetical protein PHP69_01045 [Candidatus Omnitrophica bacterium]|nr:hypothetical protein [Candidatus Omnitrophota bacterium]MDD5081172.1 hypothetical protein [Candidatus Omnitrophota bacterium]MDD5441048.1 hypothetical protein [Candidatus Omnitrophota bacterium]